MGTSRSGATSCTHTGSNLAIKQQETKIEPYSSWSVQPTLRMFRTPQLSVRHSRFKYSLTSVPYLTVLSKYRQQDMGRFLPPAPFREDFGCVRNSSASSGLCVTLGRKLNTDEPMDTQYCEDKIIEQNVEGEGLIVGIFDGHGGHKCSRVASERLVHCVAQLMEPASTIGEEALISTFRSVDRDWCNGANSDESGTTATLGVIQGHRLTIAHIGDTKAIRILKNGTCECLTTAHRASNLDERAKVIARGGEIPECSQGECARVNGLIEVTRSLGDRWLKPVLDCTPDVVSHELTDDDAFLVLGSDGLFDSVDDDAVVSTRDLLILDILRHNFPFLYSGQVQARVVTKEAGKGTSLCDIAFTLAKMAYRNGSMDDISAYVLSLDSDKRTGADEVFASVSNSAQSATTIVSENLAPQTPDLRLSSDIPSDSLGESVSWQNAKVPNLLELHPCKSEEKLKPEIREKSGRNRWRQFAWRTLRWSACFVATATAASIVLVVSTRRRR